MQDMGEIASVTYFCPSSLPQAYATDRMFSLERAYSFDVTLLRLTSWYLRSMKYVESLRKNTFAPSSHDPFHGEERWHPCQSFLLILNKTARLLSLLLPVGTPTLGKMCSEVAPHTSPLRHQHKISAVGQELHPSGLLMRFSFKSNNQTVAFSKENCPTQRFIDSLINKIIHLLDSIWVQWIDRELWIISDLKVPFIGNKTIISQSLNGNNSTPTRAIKCWCNVDGWAGLEDVLVGCSKQVDSSEEHMGVTFMNHILCTMNKNTISFREHKIEEVKE